MASYTTTAESVIDATINDGQVQTTNRVTLLNYVNRVHTRILRESKWLFLRSQEKYFVTEPGVSSYWLGVGSAPYYATNTGLSLSDVGSIIPDSVFDYSNSRQLTQDSAVVLKGYGFRYADGSYRADRPRTYAYDYNLPNVINLYPPPDNQNEYIPLPLAGICNSVSGSQTLTNRQYYVRVTSVDSFGGESLPSTEITPVSITANDLLTVSFSSLNVESGNLTNYAYYNVYIGTSVSGPFYLQNTSPIPIGAVWTEPVGGVTPGFYSFLTSILVPDTAGNTYSLSISSSGLIQTTLLGPGIPTIPTFLTDNSGQTWLLQVQPGGMLTTTQEISLPQINPTFVNSVNQIWKLFVTTSGELETYQFSGGDVAAVAPIMSTITPILGYVIGFRYQKAKIAITQSTQILQIPDDYFDVVIAGVNYYANLYTAKIDDEQIKAGLWKREFMEGLTQIRRDLRINFRNTDVISPDPTSQYMIGTQTGYAWPYNES